MAKTDEAGEYQRPDAKKAFEIYDKQIKPKEAHMATLRGDMSQPYADIKEQAHFPRSVLNFVIKMENMEEAKRDHHLLALREALTHRKLFLPKDLFSAEGEEVIPEGDRDDGELLVDAAEDDDDFEASEAELAKQEGRAKLKVVTDAPAKPKAAAKPAPRKASVSKVQPLH